MHKIQVLACKTMQPSQIVSLKLSFPSKMPVISIPGWGLRSYWKHILQNLMNEKQDPLVRVCSNRDCTFSFLDNWWGLAVPLGLVPEQPCSARDQGPGSHRQCVSCVLPYLLCPRWLLLLCQWWRSARWNAGLCVQHTHTLLLSCSLIQIYTSTCKL